MTRPSIIDRLRIRKERTWPHDVTGEIRECLHVLLDRIEALESRPTVSSEAATQAERLVPIRARWTRKLSHAEHSRSQTEPEQHEAPGQVAAASNRRDERPADCEVGEVEGDTPELIADECCKAAWRDVAVQRIRELVAKAGVTK